MLASPIITGLAGFVPTVVMLVVCCLFMSANALLLLEATLWLPEHTNLLSLAEKTINKTAKKLTGAAFIFLFACLIIAYLAKGGDLVQQALLALVPISLPTATGAILLTMVSTLALYLGTHFVSRFNAICMIGLFLAYFILLFFGNELIEPKRLSFQNWRFSPFLIPFLIPAFGFHNMIPTIKDYIGPYKKKLIITVLLGGLIPFTVYFLWSGKVLSILPVHGEISLLSSFHREEIATEPLCVLLQAPFLRIATIYFAFFAIITSLLGQSLSVLDFLMDGVRWKKTPRRRLWMGMMIFLPTLFLSQIFPHVFFAALELAGGIAAILLFGILPPIMVWRGRYHLKWPSFPFLPGGRFSLSLLFGSSCAILLFELLKKLGFIVLPLP